MNSHTADCPFNIIEYDDFLSVFHRNFADRVEPGVPLFSTVYSDLSVLYLSAYSDAERQTYNCRACRQFISRYGGLVTIDGHGITEPVLWSLEGVPVPHAAPIAALRRAVAKAEVDGIFLSDAPVWGQPWTCCAKGGWSHLSVTPPPQMVNKPRLYTAAQQMAAKREDYRTMVMALRDLRMDVISTAVKLLEADALHYSEKALGAAQWLQQVLSDRQAYAGQRQRDNLLWRAVATAPPGFCHPRSTMIGTLLEDISAGLEFDDVKRRFDSKMHPLRYARPQAAPAAGNIARAETIVETLGVAASLQRRYARLDELEKLWVPRPPMLAHKVFGNVKPKVRVTKPVMQVRSTPLTCAKFMQTVLPGAERIDVKVPYRANNWTAYVTAVDFDAPPILLWDSPLRRNPVSWYMYASSSSAEDWNLTPHTWCQVDAVIRRPPEWYDNRFPQFSEGIGLILQGAKDRRHATAGACLFPSFLKAEFHAVRATIEAYSHTMTLAGSEEASACGLSIDNGFHTPVTIRVKTDHISIDYTIDRWD